MQALDFKHQFGNYRWGQIIQIRHREFSSWIWRTFKTWKVQDVQVLLPFPFCSFIYPGNCYAQQVLFLLQDLFFPPNRNRNTDKYPHKSSQTWPT
jgi:hypothetical protein